MSAQEPLLQAEEIGSLEMGQAPDPSTERKGLFIPVIRICLRMWEGRALTSREEGSGVALWGKGQTKHLSRVSSPNLHFY